jgi:hypothetical protein
VVYLGGLPRSCHLCGVCHETLIYIIIGLTWFGILVSSYDCRTESSSSSSRKQLCLDLWQQAYRASVSRGLYGIRVSFIDILFLVVSHSLRTVLYLWFGENLHLRQGRWRFAPTLAQSRLHVFFLYPVPPCNFSWYALWNLRNRISADEWLG